MRHLMAPPVWGVLAGLTGLAGYLPYLRDAWRRVSDPDPAAWLIWTIQYAILLAAQAAQHPPWPALSLAGLQLAGTIGVFAVLAARGGWCFSPPRCAVLGGAVIVMTVWWFTRAPAPAMCLALAVEGAGMVLVMVNAYRHPGCETILTWWVFIAAGLLDLPALREHSLWVLYAYPVFFIVMGTGVLIATATGARSAARRSTALAAAQCRPAEAGLPRTIGRAAAPRPSTECAAQLAAVLQAAEIPAGVRLAEATALLRAATGSAGPGRTVAP